MSDSHTYKINEIFYSLQGEGVRSGEPSVFIRFSDCNLRCTTEKMGFDCDTEFLSGRKMTAHEIILEARRLSKKARWVILTGGEPSLQVDEELIKDLHAEDFQIAIESNGLKPISENIDWVTISPKTAEHSLQQKTANELKYVRSFGMGLPCPSVQSEHYLISPAFQGELIDRRDLEWCIQLCKDNPPWRLSVQQHKLWKIR